MCSTRTLTSCSLAAFSLIMVGYITQQSLILLLLSVSHIFAVFTVIINLIIRNRRVYASPWTNALYMIDAYSVTAAVKLYHSSRLIATALISGLWLCWGLP